MAAVTHQHRSALGLFPDKPAPWLYDRIVEVLLGLLGSRVRRSIERVFCVDAAHR
jgi:hypothetical protein